MIMTLDQLDSEIRNQHFEIRDLKRRVTQLENPLRQVLRCQHDPFLPACTLFGSAGESSTTLRCQCCAQVQVIR